MRRALGLAVAVTVAGCNTVPSAPKASTADIEAAILTYDWSAGAQPPARHLEIVVAPDGTGRVTFWPDYPGRAPAQQRDFRVTADQMAALRSGVASAVEGQTAVRPADAPPPGSGNEQIVVARGDRITTVQADSPREQAARAARAIRAFRAAVPGAVWAEFDRLTPARDFSGGV